LNQICNSDGNNYIHCAIKGNNIKCLIVVLYYSDLKHLEDKNHDNLTPLKLAEDKGRLCAVKLIEHFKMNFKKKVYKENSNVIEQLNQLNRFTLLKLYHNKEYEKTGNLIELYKLMENIKYQYLNNCNNIINQFPKIKGVMIGRGAIKNPAIFREIKGGKPISTEELIVFTYKLIENYNKVLSSDTFTLHKIKEIWMYIMLNFPDEKKIFKSIKKSSKLSQFMAEIEKLPQI
jgi:tRNA-dihydrouridine synthase